MWTKWTRYGLSLAGLIFSIILVIAGFRCLDNSAVWGMKDMLAALSRYQHVNINTADLADNLLESSVRTYNIKGILLVALGAGLLFASIPSRFLRNKNRAGS